jgi:hypothetical protein
VALSLPVVALIAARKALVVGILPEERNTEDRREAAWPDSTYSYFHLENSTDTDGRW